MFLTLFKKELIMELRSKQMILSMLVFGLSIILIIALSTNVSKVILMNYSPGLFWLMNLFIVVLAVHRSFNYEKEFDAFPHQKDGPAAHVLPPHPIVHADPFPLPARVLVVGDGLL